jgi:drug/metabolite transporter (DMT)-like permease
VQGRGKPGPHPAQAPTQENLLTFAATRHPTPASLTRGYAICLTGTVIWSTTAIFIRYLTENYSMPPLVLAVWRDLFLSVFLAMLFVAFWPARLHPGRRNLGFLAAYGLVVSLFNSLWTISVALNGAAVSTVLAYSSAGFTALLGWRLLGEKLNPTKIFAVSLSLVGCVFVSGAYDPEAWQLNTIGIITGLSSGIAFAAYSLMGRTAAHRHIDPWTTLLYAFAFATVFLLAYNILPLNLPAGLGSTNLLWLGDQWAAWAILILLAIGPTLGGYGLYTVSLAYLPASIANVIATLEPVMTAILAFLLLGERFTGPQFLGSALIIGGVIVLRLSEGRSA